MNDMQNEDTRQDLAPKKTSKAPPTEAQAELTNTDLDSIAGGAVLDDSLGPFSRVPSHT
jgi:hypothetical protein